MEIILKLRNNCGSSLILLQLSSQHTLLVLAVSFTEKYCTKLKKPIKETALDLVTQLRLFIIFINIYKIWSKTSVVVLVM